MNKYYIILWHSRGYKVTDEHAPKRKSRNFSPRFFLFAKSDLCGVNRLKEANS